MINLDTPNPNIIQEDINSNNYTFKSFGRWTKEEHQKFLEGVEKYGKNWKQVEDYVGTRNGAQIRSHAQKFFNRLEREYNIRLNNANFSKNDKNPKTLKRKMSNDSLKTNRTYHTNHETTSDDCKSIEYTKVNHINKNLPKDQYNATPLLHTKDILSLRQHECICKDTKGTSCLSCMADIPCISCIQYKPNNSALLTNLLKNKLQSAANKAMNNSGYEDRQVSTSLELSSSSTSTSASSYSFYDIIISKLETSSTNDSNHNTIFLPKYLKLSDLVSMPLTHKIIDAFGNITRKNENHTNKTSFKVSSKLVNNHDIHNKLKILRKGVILDDIVTKKIKLC